MKSKITQVVLTSLGLIVVLGYLLWSMFILPDHRGDQPCRNVRVYLTDSTTRQFLKTNEIISMLRQNKLYPQGITQSQLDAGAIEKLIASHNLIRSAQCYTTPGGDIIISLKQKEPKFRVISTNGDYFVDTERTPMLVTTRTASYVPIVTGNLTQDYATGEMFEFIDYIEHNSFWGNQIEQIVVVNDQMVKLIPRIGSHTIILGSIDRYEQKLDKLKTLYTEGFSKKTGWINYKEIDLRFYGQVVCR